MPYPLVDYVGLYTAASASGAQVGYAAIGAPAGQGSQLLGGQPPEEGYLREPYRYVLTTFGGLEGRRPLARAGRYGLFAAAPVDVLVAGVSAWTGSGGGTLPYATGPFELWVSSPRRGVVALEVGLASGPGSLAFSAGSRLPASESRGTWCAAVPVVRGTTRVSVVPMTDRPTAPLGGTWESDADRIAGRPPPAAAAGLALARVSASWRGC